MASEEIIHHIGCVIKFKSPKVKEEQSGSGILFNPHEGIILAHGSLLNGLCLKNEILASQIIRGQFINKKLFENIQFEAMVDSRWKKCSANTKIEEPGVPSDCVASSFPVLYSCRGISAFRNSEFHSALRRVMPAENWDFESALSEETRADNLYSNENKDLCHENGEESKITYHLLSYFLILKMDPVTLVDKQVLAGIENLKDRIANQCSVGDHAEVVSTPFGSLNPSVFFNTYSCGVISNIHGCWIITDARCIPGSEGGPLFTTKRDHSKRLTGMIVASLCWKNKEWIGFSLACSISSILDNLAKQLTNKVKFPSFFKVQNNHLCPVDLIQRQKSHFMSESESHLPVLASTVLISVGGTWGSGVVVNESLGIIMTCSHVIKNSERSSVMVKTMKSSTEYPAQVVYRHSDPLHGPFDVGVLLCPKATSRILSHSVPCIRPPKLGEKVMVVGHALFSSDLELLPSISAGVISKVINVHNQPVMVQSTCAVHAGTSGGPLLSESGDLVGIVVCNTVDKGSNSSYPHINMTIPAVSLLPALNHYIKTKDPSEFSSYYILDPVIRKLWALESMLVGKNKSKLTNFIDHAKLGIVWTAQLSAEVPFRLRKANCNKIQRKESKMSAKGS